MRDHELELLATLEERIRTLLGRPPAGVTAEEIEDVLTTGHARRLQLEGACLRLERELLATAGSEAASDAHALRSRLDAATSDVERLRALLFALAAERQRRGPLPATERRGPPPARV